MTKQIIERLKEILSDNLPPYKIVYNNLIVFSIAEEIEKSDQTSGAFSNKWGLLEHGSREFHELLEFQKKWYLKLYGFRDEAELADFLKSCKFIIDAGSGNSGKAAWFASLSPSTKVIAVELSNSIYASAEHFHDLPNLYFIRGDIGSMGYFRKNAFDFVNCDQVIHHTSNPFNTFKELVRVTKPERQLTCYVYRKKSLPRELLDEYFRRFSKSLSHEELLTLSHQLTKLGKCLSELKIDIDVPDIPLLKIKGGRMPVQRFVYWNFLKCYWNDDVGYDNSVLTNYDWYSPSRAERYSEEEFRSWISNQNLHEVYFHKEPACYSGRFLKRLLKN